MTNSRLPSIVTREKLVVSYKGINLRDYSVTSFKLPENGNHALSFMSAVIASLNNSPHTYGVIYFLDDSCIKDVPDMENDNGY